MKARKWNEEIFKSIEVWTVDSEEIVRCGVKGQKFVNLEHIRRVLGIKKEEDIKKQQDKGELE